MKTKKNKLGGGVINSFNPTTPKNPTKTLGFKPLIATSLALALGVNVASATTIGGNDASGTNGQTTGTYFVVDSGTLTNATLGTLSQGKIEGNNTISLIWSGASGLVGHSGSTPYGGTIKAGNVVVQYGDSAGTLSLTGSNISNTQIIFTNSTFIGNIQTQQQNNSSKPHTFSGNGNYTIDGTSYALVGDIEAKGQGANAYFLFSNGANVKGNIYGCAGLNDTTKEIINVTFSGDNGNTLTGQIGNGEGVANVIFENNATIKNDSNSIFKTSANDGRSLQTLTLKGQSNTLTGNISTSLSATNGKATNTLNLQNGSTTLNGSITATGNMNSQNTSNTFNLSAGASLAINGNITSSLGSNYFYNTGNGTITIGRASAKSQISLSGTGGKGGMKVVITDYNKSGDNDFVESPTGNGTLNLSLSSLSLANDNGDIGQSFIADNLSGSASIDSLTNGDRQTLIVRFRDLSSTFPTSSITIGTRGNTSSIGSNQSKGKTLLQANTITLYGNVASNNSSNTTINGGNSVTISGYATSNSSSTTQIKSSGTTSISGYVASNNSSSTTINGGNSVTISGYATSNSSSTTQIKSSGTTSISGDASASNGSTTIIGGSNTSIGGNLSAQYAGKLYIIGNGGNGVTTLKDSLTISLNGYSDLGSGKIVITDYDSTQQLNSTNIDFLENDQNSILTNAKKSINLNVSQFNLNNGDPIGQKFVLDYYSGNLQVATLERMGGVHTMQIRFRSLTDDTSINLSNITAGNSISIGAGNQNNSNASKLFLQASNIKVGASITTTGYSTTSIYLTQGRSTGTFSITNGNKVITNNSANATTNLGFLGSGTFDTAITNTQGTTNISLVNGANGVITGAITTSGGSTKVSLSDDNTKLTLQGVTNTITTLSSSASVSGFSTLALGGSSNITTIKDAINIENDKGIAFKLGNNTSLILSDTLTNSGATYIDFAGDGILESNITTNGGAKTTFNLGTNDGNTATIAITGTIQNNGINTFNVNAKSSTLKSSIAFTSGTNEINFENPNGATLDWQDSDGATQAISTTDGKTNINFKNSGSIIGGISTDTNGTTTINIDNNAYATIGGMFTTSQGNTNINLKGESSGLIIKGKDNKISSIALENGTYHLSLTDSNTRGNVISKDTQANNRRTLAIDTLDTGSNANSLTLISQTTATEADTFTINNITGANKGSYNFGIVVEKGVKLSDIGASGDVLIATIKNASPAITFDDTAWVMGDFIEGTIAIKEKTDGNDTKYYLGNILNANIAHAEQALIATAFTLNYDLYMANLNSLNKRMGELRDNAHSQGVWARVFNGALSNDFGLGSKNNYTTIQAGYDYAFGFEGANNYLGVALSYALSTSTSQNAFDSNGEKRGIDNIYSNAVEVALYNSYVMDSGWYNDSIAKFSYIMSSFDISRSSGTTTNDTTNFAFTLSDEVGYIFKLGESKEWSITPQMEATFGYFNQSDFKQTLQSNSTLNSMAESILTLRTRVGSAFAYDFKNFTQKDTFNASLYIGAFYEYDYVSGGEITMDANAGIQNNELSNISSDGRVVMNVGTNMTIKDNTRLYFDFEKSFAGKINTDYQINLGVRYSFGESNGYTPMTAKKEVAPLKISEEKTEESKEAGKTEEKATESNTQEQKAQ